MSKFSILQMLKTGRVDGISSRSCVLLHSKAASRNYSGNSCNEIQSKLVHNTTTIVYNQIRNISYLTKYFNKTIPITCLKINISQNSSFVSSSVPDKCWRLGRLNHVAIAVPDLEAATALYRDVLGATVSAPQDLPSHGVTTVFVELDNTKLELLHPLGKNSPIAKFLLKNKAGGLHHVCLEVDNIANAMSTVQEAGIRCLSKTLQIGAHGKPVVFLHPADCNGVLLELEEA